jgi:hypothetical protein
MIDALAFEGLYEEIKDLEGDELIPHVKLCERAFLASGDPLHWDNFALLSDGARELLCRWYDLTQQLYAEYEAEQEAIRAAIDNAALETPLH